MNTTSAILFWTITGAFVFGIYTQILNRFNLNKEYWVMVVISGPVAWLGVIIGLILDWYLKQQKH